MADFRQNAEHYASEALAADYDHWVTFDGQSNPESLEEWIESNRPSQTYRSDGIGWICVQLPQEITEETESDVVGLQKSWEDLQGSGRPINYQTITHLAKAFNVKSGKWFMHVDSGGKVDHIWRLVAYGVMEGKLGHCAKVSPFDDVGGHGGGDSKHVICIYNETFTDAEEVFELENAIRHRCGIKCQMKYKPDVYTYLGVYRNNKWGLRPSVYESVYDICTGTSLVTTNSGEEPMDL